jgi:predicted nucleotidyltransferase
LIRTPLPDYPIEGDVIETLDGSFFEVIGFNHPMDRVIGYIKYYPTPQITDRSKIKLVHNEKKTVYYQRVSDLAARHSYIKEQKPNYLLQTPNYYFPFHAIPIADIVHHYRPEQFFELNANENKIPETYREIYQITKEFCTFLAKEANIPLNRIGVTGSLLFGLANKDSDIDLIIYGNLESMKVREVIRKYFATKNPVENLRPLNLSEFKALYQTRKDQSQVTFYEFMKYEARKLHQGMYKDKEFFLRFVEFNDRELYQKKNAFYFQEIKGLGRIKISGQVHGDQHWWLTPAWVEIGHLSIDNTHELVPNVKEILSSHHLDLSQISQTFTLRGRFIENVRLLEMFTIYGTLELVIPHNQSSYLQIVVGTNPTDYLKLL